MRGFPKKIVEFAGKFCSFKRRRYLCTTKLTRWIHLRVRIRASHARHRGSNPLSTTKRSVSGRFFCVRLRVGAESFAGIPRGFSFRAFSRAGFFRFQRFSDDVCFPIPCASRFRVFPTAACSRLPDSFACRVFAASRGRHVPDVFKCSGRPFRGGRCGIEVKGYLIGWWVYFSDLLLNLSI